MKYFFCCICLLISTQSFAIFCPKNFNSVDLNRDTIESVIKTCGAPDQQRSSSIHSDIAQDWLYYSKPQFGQNPVKMTVLIKNNLVVNINIENNNAVTSQACTTVNIPNSQATQLICQNTSQSQGNVSSTLLCGTPIQVGDTAQKVVLACGQPVYVTNLQGAAQTTAEEVTEFEYYSNPPVTLVFVNGVLRGTK